MKFRCALALGGGKVAYHPAIAWWRACCSPSIGGALGWWLAQFGVSTYKRAMIDHQSWLVVDYTMDSRVLAYLVAVSLADRDPV